MPEVNYERKSVVWSVDFSISVSFYFISRMFQKILLGMVFLEDCI